jgi:hypothetical protein
MYGIFVWDITKYTVVCGVYIRCKQILANPILIDYTRCQDPYFAMSKNSICLLYIEVHLLLLN